MSVDTEMLNHETHYAGKPVDFLANEGPLRAEEFVAPTSDSFESRQTLSIPPQEARIWSEWREQSRPLGAAAIRSTAA